MGKMFIDTFIFCNATPAISQQSIIYDHACLLIDV